MGKIIVDFNGIMKPVIHIERRVDSHEMQKLQFIPNGDYWLRTETGDIIDFFAKDDDGCVIEISIPISIEELIKKLELVHYHIYKKKSR